MKRFVKGFLCTLLLVFAFSLVPVETYAQGCVMCRAQVGEHKDKDEAKLVGTSLNTGILYLVSIPYILVATVGFIWYKQHKKNQAGA